MDTTTRPAGQPQPNVSGDAPPISYPLDVGLKKISLGRTKGYELIDQGEIDTYTVGARRYVTHAELERFVERRIAAEREARLG
jgi:hypothetical protein